MKMTSVNSLLTNRNKMKAKKPRFQRQDANIFKQFRGKWRKPKGIHSKLRRGFKGHGGFPSIGYSSPAAAKGLTRKGFVPFIVFNLNDLEKIDNKLHVVVLAHSVGTKKRIELLKKIKEKKLHIFGVKDVDVLLTKLSEYLQLKKNESNKKKDKKKTEQSVKDGKNNNESKVLEEKKDESKE